MKRSLRFWAITAILLVLWEGLTLGFSALAWAQETSGFLDDKRILDSYVKKFSDETKETLWAMIADDTLSTYKMAAALRIFKDKYAPTIFNHEKVRFERMLLQRLAENDSPFVKIEIYQTLCILDRYRFFKYAVPPLVRYLEHYNKFVNQLAYDYLSAVIKSGTNRAREARIIFNTLRKIFFLNRNKLGKTKEPGEKLKQELEILRWAIKILGNEYLERLPPEAIRLL